MLDFYKKHQSAILLTLVISLVVGALIFNSGAEFAGADGAAEDLISEVNPSYTPWFTNVWEPPSSEIESLLFSLQAALGSGVLFYILGYYRGRKATKPTSAD